MKRREVILGMSLGLASGVLQARTASKAPGVAKIGILTDMSGVYSDMNGMGSVVAARLAIEDFGGKVLGKPIELIYADHQQKADVATSITNRWIDTEGVSTIMDLTNSAIALAVQNIAKAKDRITVFTSPGSNALNGANCTPISFHWVYSNYSATVGPVTALLKHGKKRWYVLVADFEFGHSLEAIGEASIKAAGGEIVGSSKFPMDVADMSAYIINAKAAKPDAILLATAGRNLSTAIKQANEYGVVAAGIDLVAPVIFISDIHAVGLRDAGGLTFVDPFYWNRTAATRTWSERFAKLHGGVMPTSIQAGDYSAVTHYLKAVEAAGTLDAAVVADKMRAIQVNDGVFTDNGRIRSDGMLMKANYLARVKTPAQSKGSWDYEELLETLEPEDVFMPLGESKCYLVKG